MFNMATIIAAVNTAEVQQLERAGYTVKIMTLREYDHYLQSRDEKFDREDYVDAGFLQHEFGHSEWMGHAMIDVDCDAGNLLFHGLINGLRENHHHAEADMIARTENKTTWPHKPPAFWFTESWDHIDSNGIRCTYRIAIPISSEVKEDTVRIDILLPDRQCEPVRLGSKLHTDILEALDEHEITDAIENGKLCPLGTFGPEPAWYSYK